ncbi:MAG TPA: hypothetical protein VKU00_04615 [Chthonomonadaceae bacterium]|nr:hypothetical protein [Chthonomonadaceae bacterium]
MKRTYRIGGVEFVRDEERLCFRLSWPTLLLQTFLYLLLIPFIGYALAWPLFQPDHSARGTIPPGALILGLFIEAVLLIFLVGRILDRVRPYALDLRDRTFRHGNQRLCSLDDILTITVIQRNQASSLEFTLRQNARTLQALRLPSFKGANAAAKEVAQFLGMGAQNREET